MQSVFQQQNIRTTQLMQDYHPVLRRRAYTSIRNSFPGFSKQHNRHQHQQSLPPSMNESQKAVYENFSKINHIIDVVDQHIRKRIQCYQNEVVNVVQKEIEQMREQTQKVVAQFNIMILQKNKQQQIWSLNNQLDYFKSQAKKLFDSNKHLKHQNLQLTKKIQQYEWELQNRQVIMQKLLYKYQKEKYSKNVLKLKMDTQLATIKQKNSNYLQNQKQDLKLNNKYSLIENITDIKSSLAEAPGIKQKNNKQATTKSPKKQPQFFSINKTSNNNTENYLQQNSLLQIDYQQDDQEQKEREGQKCLWENIKKEKKPELKDQQSQVNIYLSEHSYKTLFEKERPMSKMMNKKLNNFQCITKQQSTQTESTVLKFSCLQNDQNKRKAQNEIKQYSSPKAKSINFIKNGFTIIQPSIQKQHNRTHSYHMNTTKRELSTGGLFNKQSKQRNQRINTEMNFNRSREEEFMFEMLTPKQDQANTNSKFFHKMANKFQRNKIAERAYDKSKTYRMEGKKR